MSTPVAISAALFVGALLTYGASRATASVSRGTVFLRWMIAVFITYLALISLPVVASL